MTVPADVDPPQHLSEESAVLWRHIVAGYAIEEHQLPTMRLALEALDQAAEARQEIVEHGAVIADRFGQLKPSPWVQIERDARSAHRLLLRELNLGGEPDEGPRLPRVDGDRR